MRDKNLTRREFLKSGLAAAAGLGLTRFVAARAEKLSQGSANVQYLPVVINNTPRPYSSRRVIHLHAPNVTDWDFDPAIYYGRTQALGVSGVNQSVVDYMVDRGVTDLFGLPLSSLTEAWSRIIPGYSPGKQVAIKINITNSHSCDTLTSSVDAIAQPINAVVRGLKLLGISDQDIVIYDSSSDYQHFFSNRLLTELVNKNMQFFDSGGCTAQSSTWDSSDPNAIVHFSDPVGNSITERLCDPLVNATYLINMPIMKGHPTAGVTLGFKNHFGSSIHPSFMHPWVDTSYEGIDQYNILVDLYSNPHIRNKTCLIIGDGIYASKGFHDSPPERWTSFNNQAPCSLFFATDPVAIDCVMHDLLKAERGSAQPDTSNAYLKLAEQVGMGVYESGNPWQTPYGSGYSKIIYTKIEL
jgi:uncharacterized protein (DUF362 family)